LGPGFAEREFAIRNKALIFLYGAAVSGIAVYAEGKLAPAASMFVLKAKADGRG
jgi:hypothetical protein